MSKTIAELRAALLRNPQGETLRKASHRAQGRFGEILVEAWLRESPDLEVFPIPQTKETKRDWLKGDGKRADFLVVPAPEGGEQTPAAAEGMLIDAKFHALDGDLFWIDEKEVDLYRKMMTEWGARWLFFAVIPKREPNRIIVVEVSEMEFDSRLGRRVFQICNTGDRDRRISADEYQRSLDQLARENYEAGFVPEYPT